MTRWLIVIAHRMRREQREGVNMQSWETATTRLRPAAVGEVLQAVEANGLMALRRAYHADVDDGTQWVLWIKQWEREKSVYFNHNFPRAITRFAEELDRILAAAGLDKVAWQPVPREEARRQARELWDCTRR
jgi:hypothetical protein